jgi:quercetin dioxygenase-like cupin family protein
MKPYNDIETANNYIVREFDENIDPIELMWHRDLNERTITILEGEGWKFQLDNQLPISLNKNDTIFIPALTYHRVIKGNTKLKLKINERFKSDN